MKIEKLHAREVLDSRGNPTIEADITVSLDGRQANGRAMVPSGASTGEKEARELRDLDPKRYFGKGVLKAVSNVNTTIAKGLLKKDFARQADIDSFLLRLDGSENKSRLGANALLAVSMAFARANSIARHQPLHRGFEGFNAATLPVPCMNVINGGRHADNNVDFQEFMIAPHNAPSFKEAIRMGEEVFHTLKGILKSKGYYTGVGDEGGFAPNLQSNEEAVEVILQAIVKAGYRPGEDVSLCLDPATSEMWDENHYVLFKSSQEKMTSTQLLGLWENWTRQYPILLLEDGMGENDWEGWKALTQSLGRKIELTGDDIFCTNPGILQKGIDNGIGNSVLIKLNQIGTVTETLDTIRLAYEHDYRCFISHRSGETEDPFIADLTVGTGAGHLKTGSGCRSERIAKFNQLIRIEEELGPEARFAGITAFKNQ